MAYAYVPTNSADIYGNPDRFHGPNVFTQAVWGEVEDDPDDHNKPRMYVFRSIVASGSRMIRIRFGTGEAQFYLARNNTVKVYTRPGEALSVRPDTGAAGDFIVLIYDLDDDDE